MGKVWINRDTAELVADLLEKNYVEGGTHNCGVGADYAKYLREEWGMKEQPELKKQWGTSAIDRFKLQAYQAQLNSHIEQMLHYGLCVDKVNIKDFWKEDTMGTPYGNCKIFVDDAIHSMRGAILDSDQADHLAQRVDVLKATIEKATRQELTLREAIHHCREELVCKLSRDAKSISMVCNAVESTLPSSIVDRINDAKVAYEIQHPRPAKHLYLGKQQYEELKDYLAGMFFYSSSLHDEKKNKYDGMELVQVDKDSFLEVG